MARVQFEVELKVAVVNAVKTGNAGLPHFMRCLQCDSAVDSPSPAVVVAFGDSVTQGIGPVGQLYLAEVYHQQLSAAIAQRYPRAQLQMINAGVDGDSASDGLKRIDRDVIVHQPVLVIIAFGLNDAALFGLEGIDKFGKALEAMVDVLRIHTAADIILMTPNTMATRDSDAVAECHRHLVPAFREVQHNGILAAYAECIRTVGRLRHVPIADVYAKWESLEAGGCDTTAMLSNGLNHPDAQGHSIAAGLLWNVIESSSADVHNSSEHAVSSDY